MLNVLGFNINIDLAILIVFLIVTLLVGITYGRNVKNTGDYALGGRNFRTSSLIFTNVATCIGGGFFAGAMSETYKQGLYFIIPGIGEGLGMCIIGLVFVPRMRKMIGHVSIASAMGDRYGNIVRLITAVAGLVLCTGIIGTQFRTGARILQVFFDIPVYLAIVASSIIVIIYSAFGGIRSVTFTDILQTLTFSVAIPLIILVIQNMDGGASNLTYLFTTNENFMLDKVFDITNPKFMSAFCLMLFFLLPSMQPVFFQRVSMASDIKQARSALTRGGIICVVFFLFASFIGMLLLSIDNTLESDNLLSHIIEHYTYTGLKGLVCIGIMSIIMSTADSYINTAGTLVNNDILSLLPIKLKRPLLAIRLASLAIGVVSLNIAFKMESILSLFLQIFSFWFPVVTVPFVMTIFNFRLNSKYVLTGMLTSFITVLVLIYTNIFKSDEINLIIGMAPNVMILLYCHFYESSATTLDSFQKKKQLFDLDEGKKKIFSTK